VTALDAIAKDTVSAARVIGGITAQPQLRVASPERAVDGIVALRIIDARPAEHLVRNLAEPRRRGASVIDCGVWIARPRIGFG
jgi:hypothetical protein